jgi:hypothetical protein
LDEEDETTKLSGGFSQEKKMVKEVGTVETGERKRDREKEEEERERERISRGGLVSES